MDNVLGYVVLNGETNQWLGEDDQFQHTFFMAREFSSAQEANEAMERTGGDYVLAVMPSP